MKTKVIASSLVVAFLATACESPKQAIGTVGGGALGAWAGSTIGKGSGNVVATAVGAVVGALAGGYVGGQLDQTDRDRAGRAAQEAFENGRSGHPVSWRNPDTGHHGTVTPKEAHKTSYGRYCREYTHTIVVGGKKQEAFGKACRCPDGTWEIVESGS